MRIGMVCPYSLSVPGGVQGQALALCRVLRQLGHEARLLAPCDGPPPDAGVTPLGPSMPTASNGSVAPISPWPTTQVRLLQAFREEDFDVVHVHEPFCPGPSQTTVISRPGPVVGTFHAAGDGLPYRWVRPLVRRVSYNIDVNVAVSEDARASAASGVGRGQYLVLFNGVDVEHFAKAGPFPRDDRPTVLFVGRHEPRKGLAVLLDAVGRLPAEVRLWVAGDGPETRELRARTAGDPRIEWLGRISEEEKASRMRAADVFCAPSISGESFGVVLLEAMAADTAVVASDLPGYANVARSGADALLVPPGDSGALAGALRAALADPARRAALVASGEERADMYSMERLAERYVALYHQAIERHRGRR